MIVSDGKPQTAHVGPSPQLLTGSANIRGDLVGSIFDSFGVPRSLFLASGVRAAAKRCACSRPPPPRGWPR